MSRFRGSGARVPDAQRAERGQVVVIFASSILCSWACARSPSTCRGTGRTPCGCSARPTPPRSPASSISPATSPRRTVARAEAAKNGYSTASQASPSPRPRIQQSAAAQGDSPRRQDVLRARVRDHAFPAQRDSRRRIIVLPGADGQPPELVRRVRQAASTRAAGSRTPRPPPARPPVRVDRGAERQLVESRQRRCKSTNTSYAVSGTADRLEPALVVVRTAGHGGRPSSATSIDGIEVLTSSLLTGSGTTITSCRLLAHLSWDNGATWTTRRRRVRSRRPRRRRRSAVRRTSGVGTWTRSELGNAHLAGPPDVEPRRSGADPNRNISVDTLQVRVSYHYPVSTSRPTTNVAGPPAGR